MDRKKVVRIVFIAFVIIIFSFIGYKVLFKRKTAGLFDEKDNIEVAVQVVNFKPITLTKKYIGNITPINSVSVLPFVSGFIDKVLVKGGQNVKVGDTLFLIRQAKYKANMDAAYAHLKKF